MLQVVLIMVCIVMLVFAVGAAVLASEEKKERYNR
jgi:hypothetical protein